MIKTTIQISIELKERLEGLGRKGETYETILWRLLKESKGGGNNKK